MEENKEVVNNSEFTETPQTQEYSQRGTTGYVTPQMEKLLAELEELRAKSANMDELAKKVEKIDRIEKALKDEPNVDEFYTRLAENPKQAIEKLIEEKTKPIIEERQKEFLLQSDEKIFNKLSVEDPEFKEIWSNLGKYVTEDEVTEVENSPKRVELLYGLAKARKLLQETQNKINSKEELKQAKEELNKTAFSERPSGGAYSGGSVKKDEEEDERVINLAKARENFDTKTAVKNATDILWDVTQWGKRFKR